MRGGGINIEANLFSSGWKNGIFLCLFLSASHAAYTPCWAVTNRSDPCPCCAPRRPLPHRRTASGAVVWWMSTRSGHLLRHSVCRNCFVDVVTENVCFVDIVTQNDCFVTGEWIAVKWTTVLWHCSSYGQVAYPVICVTMVQERFLVWDLLISLFYFTRSTKSKYTGKVANWGLGLKSYVWPKKKVLQDFVFWDVKLWRQEPPAQPHGVKFPKTGILSSRAAK